MNISLYDLYQDDKQHPTLICEQTVDYQGKSLTTPEAVTEMLNTVFRADKRSEEHMYMISINAANEVLGVFDVSHGTQCETCADPRGIYVRALQTGAAGIILCHNHCAGSLRASADDIEACTRLRDAGTIMSIKLIDFIIIGKKNSFLSFSREGML